MTSLRVWLSRVRAMLAARRHERALDEEIASHLDLLAQDYERRGLSPHDARAAARREFGGVEQMKEQHRDQRGLRWIDDAVRDARHGFRQLARDRAFAMVAITTIAVGIAATTSIFSIINALSLRQLPVREPGNLVQLTRVFADAPRPSYWFSNALVEALAGQTDLFDGVMGFTPTRFAVGEAGALESVDAAWVTGGYYSTLGVAPIAGRLLGRDDDRADAAPAVVMSERYWRRRFAADPVVVGRTVRIEGVPVPVVGVTPASFTGATVGRVADLTMTLAVSPQILGSAAQVSPNAFILNVLARSKRGMAPREQATRLAAAWPRILDASYPVSSRLRARLETMRIGMLAGGSGAGDLRLQLQTPLLMLMALVTLVLFSACANLANLLLARGIGRDREIATRFALGAGRARVIRQLLTETLLLSLIGAAIGTAGAWAGSRALVAFVADGLSPRLGGVPVTLDVVPDATVLAFAAAVAIGTGLIFGCGPAWRASRAALSRSRMRAVGPLTSRRAGAALVSMQVALSLVLLVGSGLFIRTLQNLRDRNPGFEPGGIVLVNIDASRTGYAGQRLAALYEDVLRAAQAVPRVHAATLSRLPPISGGGEMSFGVLVNGRSIGHDETVFNEIGPHYFATMQTAVRVGREFTMRDNAAAPRVAIVNEAFARRHLAGRDPRQQQLSIAGPNAPPMAIIGVVDDMLYHNLRQAPPPIVYMPVLQGNSTNVVLEVRAEGALDEVIPVLRRVLEAQLPHTVFDVRLLSQHLEASLLLERLLATLSGLFGLVALGLGAVGLYGMLAYTVNRRTTEIGVRTALGASRGDVVRLVAGDGCRMVAIGIAMGLPLAWGVTRLIGSMLFGVAATDPATLVTAIAVIGTSAALATYAPSRRAARLDPNAALRCE